MDELLEQLLDTCRPYTQEGAVASYIPELAKAYAGRLGIFIQSSDGKHYQAGDYRDTFTIQSIIKTILLLQALIDNGEDYVRARVGVEATGKPFDAINVTDQQLLSSHLNPMVNMGAIAMCTLIRGGSYDERFQRLLALTRTLAGNPEISVDQAVYLSEKATGDRNRALAYYLKASGILEGNVEECLDFYFKMCSVNVTAVDIAQMSAVLANHGACPVTQEELIPRESAKEVRALMLTCGMYDGSGEFAMTVGFPAKSGVGGGIAAALVDHMGIGVFGPSLDEKGNSVGGIKILEHLSKNLDFNLF